MKLRHILYENVSVKGKAQFHQFIGGELEIEDKEEIKELLKNQNIVEVKEEEPAEEKSAGESSENADTEKEKSEKQEKKGKQK